MNAEARKVGYKYIYMYIYIYMRTEASIDMGAANDACASVPLLVLVPLQIVKTKNFGERSLLKRSSYRRKLRTTRCNPFSPPLHNMTVQSVGRCAGRASASDKARTVYLLRCLHSCSALLKTSCVLTASPAARRSTDPMRMHY